jgi:hypothetical protein
MPIARRWPPLPRRSSTDPRQRARASWMRNPARHNTTISASKQLVAALCGEP